MIERTQSLVNKNKQRLAKAEEMLEKTGQIAAKNKEMIKENTETIQKKLDEHDHLHEHKLIEKMKEIHVQQHEYLDTEESQKKTLRKTNTMGDPDSIDCELDKIFEFIEKVHVDCLSQIDKVSKEKPQGSFKLTKGEGSNEGIDTLRE